jgi:hypothetical protein
VNFEGIPAVAPVRPGPSVVDVDEQTTAGSTVKDMFRLQRLNVVVLEHKLKEKTSFVKIALELEMSL